MPDTIHVDFEVLALWRQIAGDLAAIRATLERPPPSDPLLDAIREAMPTGTDFTSRELIKFAKHEANVRLRAEILAEVGELSPHKLTPVLNRLCGRGGLVRLGSTREGVLWGLRDPAT